MDAVVLALAKNFTEKSLIGLGALKGAPCTISSIEKTTEGTDEGTNITFQYEDNEGKTYTETVFIKDGKDGVDGVDGVDGKDGKDGRDGVTQVDDYPIEGSTNAITSGAVYRLLGNADQLATEIFNMLGVV